MNQRIKTFGTLICLLIAVFAATAGIEALTRPHTYTYYNDYTAGEVSQYSNNERIKAGVKPVIFSPELTKAAIAKAKDMSLKGYFSHDTPDGKTPWDFIAATGYNYFTAGENLAIGYHAAPDVVAAWMASEGHKKNLLNPDFTEMGIAVVKEGDVFLVVQEFGKPVGQINTGEKGVVGFIEVPQFSEDGELVGNASWYSYKIGDWSSANSMVAAARNFPRGSLVEVCVDGTDMSFAKCIEVKITDFGPQLAVFPERILDLSPKAFSQLSESGTTREGVLKNVRARLVK